VKVQDQKMNCPKIIDDVCELFNFIMKKDILYLWIAIGEASGYIFCLWSFVTNFVVFL
jgi:hypothetical protein